MRTLTYDASVKSLAKSDCEPIIVVELSVTYGTTVTPFYITDRDIGVSPLQYSLGLTNVSDIILKTINKKLASAGTVTIEASDISQDLRLILSQRQFQGIPAKVYQHFVSLDFATDAILLYSGVVASPIDYDTVQRKLKFDIIPAIKTFQIPFAPTDDLRTSAINAYSSTDDEFIGRPWPVPFGRVIDAPAQVVSNGPQARLVTTIYDYSTDFLIETDPEDAVNPFPAGNINVFAGDTLFRGSFGTGANAKKFTIVEANRTITSVVTSMRPATSADPDAARSDVLYVKGEVNINGVIAYPQVVGTWMIPTSTTLTKGAPKNYCIKQIADKCFFLNNWALPRKPPKPGAPPTPSGVAPPSPTVAWKPGVSETFDLKRHRGGDTWQITPGATISQKGSRAKIYIASDNKQTASKINATDDLKRVRAYRQVPIGTAVGNITTRQLVTVPRSYYEVDPSNPAFRHVLADGSNQDPMTVSFNPPLSLRGQGWEDDVIYCSIATRFDSDSNNRNTAAQIKYILEKYTTLTPDPVSFAAAITALADFPSDFTLYSSQDALSVCADLAWQARCSLLTIGDVVKIKYMSVPTPTGSAIAGDGVVGINEFFAIDNAGSGIVESEFEDRVTIFVAQYKNNYLNTPPTKLIKRVNVEKYGEKTEEFDFYIYGRKGLVDKSATWWSQRYGRIWKKVYVRAPLPFILFEPYDFVNVGYEGFSCVGVIESVKHDTLNNIIDLLVWVPVESGTSSPSSFGWGTVTAPGAGVIENPLTGIYSGPDDIVALSSSADGS